MYSTPLFPCHPHDAVDGCKGQANWLDNSSTIIRQGNYLPSYPGVGRPELLLRPSGRLYFVCALFFSILSVLRLWSLLFHFISFLLFTCSGIRKNTTKVHV